MRTKINIGRLASGISLTAAGWYNTVVREKSILGLVCLVSAGVFLGGAIKDEV